MRGSIGRSTSCLCRYIHLNPVKAKLVTRPEDWRYSNYLQWIGQGARALKEEAFLRDLFPTPASYESFVADYQEEERVRHQIEKYVWD